MVDKEIIDIVQRYKDVLMDKFDISVMYIFGSYSKLNFNDDSDIDVAIVVKNELNYEDELELMRRRRGIDLRIEPHLFTIGDFQKGNPLTEEIKRTGFMV